MGIEDRLRRAAPPDAPGAQDRARRVVLAATPGAARRRRRTPLLVLAALVVTGVALTPPGDAVAKWLRDLVETKPQARAPASVGRLPAGGRILADGPSGTFITSSGGRWRRISSDARPIWSPRGLFVSVVDGNRLRLIAPDGTERWTLAASGAVADPRWATTGFRIAYRRDDDLRVIAGDGSGDRPLVDSVAEVPAAWRQGPANEVAVARLGGAVELWAADSGESVWRHRAGEVRYLAWTPSGRLVAVASDELLVLSGDRGRVLLRRSLQPGVEQAALAPDGSRLAIRRARSVSMLPLRRGARERVRLVLRSEPLTTMLWTPNAEALLATSGDQWYFVTASGPVRPRTVRSPRGGVAPTDWCCAEGSPVAAPSLPDDPDLYRRVASSVSPCGVERVAWASTVPFRDGLRARRPVRTIRTLGPGDVLVLVAARTCQRRPTGSREPRLRLDDAKRQEWPGMRPGDPPLLRLSASPYGNYEADVSVFARDAAGRARADAILRNTGWPGAIG